MIFVPQGGKYWTLMHGDRRMDTFRADGWIAALSMGRQIRAKLTNDADDNGWYVMSSGGKIFTFELTEAMKDAIAHDILYRSGARFHPNLTPQEEKEVISKWLERIKIGEIP